MSRPASAALTHSTPVPSAVVELFKPITWFPPMWALACGVVSSGVGLAGHWLVLLAGVVLAGPLVCGMSQAVNDWFDRDVDAINEPHRPIPSGRIPGRWGLYIAILWTLLSLVVATVLGPPGIAAAIVGVILAWAYSAPPLRLKNNGWFGNAAVAACYEGLPWFTGAALMLGSWPDSRITLFAVLYSIGAHGIMTLNDFKAIDGDRRMGVGSLPVRLGVERAALVACVFMVAPQLAVVATLLLGSKPWHASCVAALLLLQLAMMRRFLADPLQRALWYSANGVTLYVSGMMISAFALRSWGAA
jgi:chlorophyll synthase